MHKYNLKKQLNNHQGTCHLAEKSNITRTWEAPLYSFAEVAITKYHRPGSLTEIYSHTVLEARSPWSRFWPTLFPVSTLFLFWSGPPLAEPWRGLSSLHAQGEGGLLSVSLLIKTLILPDQGPTLVTSVNLSYFLKAPSPLSATLGIRASMYELFGEGVGDSSAHI